MDARDPSLLRQPTPELRDLLRAYTRLLALVPELPRVLWLPRRRSTRLGRLVRVPRVRWLVTYFLVGHVERTTAALARRCHAAATLGEDDHQRGIDRAVIETFQRSLPPRPSTRALLFWLVFAIFFVSFVFMRYAFRPVPIPGPAGTCPKQELAQRGSSCPKRDRLALVTAKPLGRVTKAIITLDRAEAVNAIQSFDCEDVDKDGKGVHCKWTRGAINATVSVILLPLAAWVLLLLPLSSLRLTRLLFLARPPDAAAAGALAAAEPRENGPTVYELEANTFAALGAHRPRERSLDLTANAVLMIPFAAFAVSTVIFAVAAIWVTIDDYRTHYPDRASDSYGLVFFWWIAVAAVVVAGGRLLSLRRTARRRYDCVELAAVPSGARCFRRRAAAQLIDACGIAGVAVAVALLAISRLPHAELRGALDWAVATPVAALAWTLVGSSVAADGQTLGKRLARLRVELEDGTPVSLRLLVVREVAVKAVLFGIVVVPLVLDFLWPLVDHRRRAWHDIFARTVVMRVRGREVVEAARELATGDRTVTSSPWSS